MNNRLLFEIAVVELMQTGIDMLAKYGDDWRTLMDAEDRALHAHKTAERDQRADELDTRLAA